MGLIQRPAVFVICGLAPLGLWYSEDRLNESKRHGRLKLSFGWQRRIMALRPSRLTP